MSDMFCFQCQQTLHNAGCDSQKGACGKTSDVANLQDKLISKVMALSSVLPEQHDQRIDKLILDCLFVTLTNVNFDEESIRCWCDRIDLVRADYEPVEEIDLDDWWYCDDQDQRSLKSLILFGLKGIAAYAAHAANLGFVDEKINQFILSCLHQLTQPQTTEALLALAMEVGQVNLNCLALLDRANVDTFGKPTPIEVPVKIETGPFIVVTGHDLHDIYLLLEQTKDKGINIYTHGEMLPSHAYPNLRAYPHLKGHFGTAWQNQQIEFAHLPAPILFTSNCLMPVRRSYADRVFTTSVVGYEGMKHIGANKDFTPVIEKALELGGFIQEATISAREKPLLTGFGHDFVLSVADQVIDKIKQGKINHFYLVGGCDGAQIGRDYYTDFVESTSDDSIVLTLGCGKFRINNLEYGNIDGLPRLMDMGQCNDAYSAIKVASALAEAFQCSVNELPLTLVLSWYEQKAVCILLSLLALGIKNIFIGPTLPAFLSDNVLNILIDNWQVAPITNVKSDLAKIAWLHQA